MVKGQRTDFCHFIMSFHKDHIIKSAAGHYALKRLINQDKERLTSESKGRVTLNIVQICSMITSLFCLYACISFIESFTGT